MNALLELRQQRAEAVDAMKALTAKSEAENRDFDATEKGQWDGLVAQVESGSPPHAWGIRGSGSR